MRVVRGVVAWVGRLLVVLFGLACAVGPEHSTEQPLAYLSIALGAFFVGLAALTWPRTERLGTVLVDGGLWAALTGFAVIAFLDPQAVIADSRLGPERRQIDSATGAYVWGAIMGLIANGPLVAAWWLRRIDLRPDPTKDLLRDLGHPAGRRSPGRASRRSGTRRR